MFSDYVHKWLANALDYGISEAEFWDMTIAELNRAVESRKRMMKLEAQERASFDYILADLIGRSVARLHSSANQMPQISDIYPTIFDSAEMEAQRQKKRDELSALRFKQFTQSFNSKFNKEVGKGK